MLPWLDQRRKSSVVALRAQGLVVGKVLAKRFDCQVQLELHGEFLFLSRYCELFSRTVLSPHYLLYRSEVDGINGYFFS